MSKRKRLFAPEEKSQAKAKLAPPPGLRRKRAVILRQPRPEDKFFDATTAITGWAAGVNYTSGLTCNGIAAGTDRNNRIGREVYMKRLNARVSVYMPTGASASPQARFRCIAFVDKEVGAIVPAIIESVYLTRAAGQIEYNTLRNMADPSRFQVLYNQPSPMMSFEGTLMGQSRYTWEINVPLGFTTKFSSTSGATPLTNLIYIFVISEDIPSVVLTAPGYGINSRVTFSDM